MFFVPSRESKLSQTYLVPLDGVAMWLAQKEQSVLRGMNSHAFTGADIKRHIRFGTLATASRDLEKAKYINLDARPDFNSLAAKMEVREFWANWGLIIPCSVPAEALRKLRNEPLRLLPIPEKIIGSLELPLDLITFLRYAFIVRMPGSIVRMCLDEWCR